MDWELGVGEQGDRVVHMMVQASEAWEMGCEGGRGKQPVTHSSKEVGPPGVWQRLGECHPEDTAGSQNLRRTRRPVAPTLNPHTVGTGV